MYGTYYFGIWSGRYQSCRPIVTGGRGEGEGEKKRVIYGFYHNDKKK